MSEYALKVNVPGSTILIVSFAGHDKNIGGIPRFEFVHFLQKRFPHVSRHFYMDPHLNMYHQGIPGIGNTVDECAAYLKNEIQGFQQVVFVGASSGGYAAILFGSLLGVQSVVAFIPQTLRTRLDKVDEKYRDLAPRIHATTQYYLFGNTRISDIKDCHHISHCERIAHHPNVFLKRQEWVDLQNMRNTGVLYDIIHKACIEVSKTSGRVA